MELVNKVLQGYVDGELVDSGMENGLVLHLMEHR